MYIDDNSDMNSMVPPSQSSNYKKKLYCCINLIYVKDSFAGNAKYI